LLSKNAGLRIVAWRGTRIHNAHSVPPTGVRP
jgi:hypothetical protein